MPADPTIICIGSKTDRAHERGQIHMLAKLRNIARNDEGASAVEYGLLVAAIAAVLVLVVFALGGLVDDVFRDTCDQINKGAGTTPAGQEAPPLEGCEVDAPADVVE